MTVWLLGVLLASQVHENWMGRFADVTVLLPPQVDPNAAVVTVDGRRVRAGHGRRLSVDCVPAGARVRVAVGRETLAERAVTDIQPYRSALADVVQIVVEASDACEDRGSTVVGFTADDPHGFVVAQGLVAHQTPTLMVDGVIVGRVDVRRPSGFAPSFGAYMPPQRLGVVPLWDPRHGAGW